MTDHGHLVSVVTPSFNTGRFLAETIRSVLEQDFPNIEYLVMDGGSSDKTLTILKGYEDRLRYVSEPDDGQAGAVNRGFGLTSGGIFAYLNADDTYLPGAITAAVQAFNDYPEAAVVYGDGWYVREDGSRIVPYPVESFNPENLRYRCFICQPAAFVRREAFASIGMLNSRLRYAHDYDLWIRVSQQYSAVKIDAPLATLRIHDDAKTIKETEPAMLETFGVLKHHFGYVPYNWIYGFAHHRLTGQPIAIEKPRPAFPSACYSLALATRYNWRHPLKYFRDVVETARKGLA